MHNLLYHLGLTTQFIWDNAVKYFVDQLHLLQRSYVRQFWGYKSIFSFIRDYWSKEVGCHAKIMEKHLQQTSPMILVCRFTGLILKTDVYRRKLGVPGDV